MEDKNQGLQLILLALVAFGTIALAIIAVFRDKLRAWLSRPKLEITTDTKTPYCSKIIFERPDKPDLKADGYFLRISVKNLSKWHPANQVEIFASKLFRKAIDGNYNTVEYFEPINLTWSHSGKAFADISPKMIRYIFIGRIIDPAKRPEFPGMDKEGLNEEKTSLSLATEVARKNKSYIIPPGLYRLEIIVGGSNIKPFEKTLEIDIKGEWFYEEEKMFEKGFSIKFI